MRRFLEASGCVMLVSFGSRVCSSWSFAKEDDLGAFSHVTTLKRGMTSSVTHDATNSRCRFSRVSQIAPWPHQPLLSSEGLIHADMHCSLSNCHRVVIQSDRIKYPDRKSENQCTSGAQRMLREIGPLSFSGLTFENKILRPKHAPISILRTVCRDVTISANN